MRQLMMGALVMSMVSIACTSPPPDPPGIYDGHVSGNFFENQVDADATVEHDESIGWDAVHNGPVASSNLTIRTGDNRAVVLVNFATQTLNDVPPGSYEYRLTPDVDPSEKTLFVWTCQPTPDLTDDPDEMLNDVDPQHFDLNVVETDGGKTFQLHTERPVADGVAATDTTWRYVPKGLLDVEQDEG